MSGLAVKPSSLSPADGAPWTYAIFPTLLIVMCACGRWLEPASEGVGTHQQLGLPPCGFLAITGYPCPSCGLTTSISHFMHGHFIQSLVVQPFGLAIVGTLAILTFVSFKSLRSRTPLTSILYSHRAEVVQWILLMVFIASWIYKISL